MALTRRCLAFAVFVAAFGWSAVVAQTPPSLGSAASFAVLGASAVKNSGETVVSGNVGVAPGKTITGFPAGKIRLGTTAADDALAREGQRDAASAFAVLDLSPCRALTVLTAIAPDVYCLSSPLAGVITLDPGSNTDAVWIFRVTGPLNVTANSTISVINGGKNGNVYWQVSGPANLGSDSATVGNILARGDITLAHGATLLGRALSLSGNVTLDTNNISLCCEPITLSPLANASDVSAITASGGLPPYTFKIISGSPPAANQCGHFSFAVMATDALGCQGVKTYAVDIKSTIVISPPAVPNGVAGSPYPATQITASGGVAPYTFSVVSGALPPGLSIPSGLLSGIPTTTGSFCATIQATDAQGCTGTISYRIIINPGLCPTITVTLSAATPAIVGVPYSATLIPTGGTPPYTFTVASGALPQGLSLNSATGAISGIPTAAGATNVTIVVTDSGMCLGSLACTIIDVTYIPAMSGQTLLILAALLAAAGLITMRRNG